MSTSPHSGTGKLFRKIFSLLFFESLGQFTLCQPLFNMSVTLRNSYYNHSDIIPHHQELLESSWWWAIILLETRWAVKEQWNNKLFYTVASCWSFLKNKKISAFVSAIIVYRPYIWLMRRSRITWRACTYLLSPVFPMNSPMLHFPSPLYLK
jgi:hypothetical protein